MQGDGELDVEVDVDAGRQLDALAAAAVFLLPTTAQTGRAAGSLKSQKGLEPNSPIKHASTCRQHEELEDVRGVRAYMIHTTAMGDRDGQLTHVLSTPPVSRAVRRLLIPLIMPLATGSRTTRETAPKAEAPPPAGWGHTRRSRPASKRADDNAAGQGHEGDLRKIKLIGVQAREEAAKTGPHFSPFDLSFLLFSFVSGNTGIVSNKSKK